MIKSIKMISRNIRTARVQGIDEEPFNGFGFMRRVYGVEEIPVLETLEDNIDSFTSDDSVIEENS